VHLLLRLEQSSLVVINAILDLACGRINTDSCGHQPLLGEVQTAAQHILVSSGFYIFIAAGEKQTHSCIILLFSKVAFIPSRFSVRNSI